MEHAWREVQRILDHPAWSPREKIRRVARLHFLAESGEVAALGRALQDAEVFFADEPEHLAPFKLLVRKATKP